MENQETDISTIAWLNRLISNALLSNLTPNRGAGSRRSRRSRRGVEDTTRRPINSVIFHPKKDRGGGWVGGRGWEAGARGDEGARNRGCSTKVDANIKIDEFGSSATGSLVINSFRVPPRRRSVGEKNEKGRDRFLFFLSLSLSLTSFFSLLFLSSSSRCRGKSAR